jgi:hypothetical protein
MLAKGHVTTRLRHYIHEYFPTKLGRGVMGGKESENLDQGSINLRKGEERNKDETIRRKENKKIKIKQLEERRREKYGLGQH